MPIVVISKNFKILIRNTFLMNQSIYIQDLTVEIWKKRD